MKNRPHYLIIFIISFNVLNCFGQSDFRQGHIITNQKDTIPGWVNYHGEIKNAKICIFKLDKTGEFTEYLPGDIFGYRFESGKFYITREITIKDQKSLVFAEYLLNGNIDLYYYKNFNTDYYFLELADGNIYELSNEELTLFLDDGSDVVKESNKHIGILNYAFSDYMEIFPEIEKVNLTHKSLIDITKKYHEYTCDGEQCIIYEKPKPHLGFQYGISIGYSLSSIYPTPRNNIVSSLDFEKSKNPFVNLLLDIKAPRWHERILLQTNVNLGKYYFYANKEIVNESFTKFIEYNLNSFYYIGSLGLKILLPEAEFQPYFSTGITLSSTINPNGIIIAETMIDNNVSTTETSDPFPIKTYHGIYLQLGCNFRSSDKLVYFTNFKGTYSQNDTKLDTNSDMILSSSIEIGIYF